jgi:hypothetical protein
VLKINPRLVQIAAIAAVSSMLLVTTAHPETPDNAIARDPFADSNRPPFADSNRPPFADNNRPPFADSNRPPFADNNRPPFADNNRPPFADNNRQNPWDRSDEERVVKLRNGAVRLPNGDIVRLDD